MKYALALSLLFFTSTQVAADDYNIENPTIKPEFKLDFSKPPVKADPKSRAQDFEHAFLAIKEADPKAKIYMIVNGISIDKIVDVKVMPQGTLIMLSIKSRRGLKHRVIKVEEIEDLGQR